MELNQQNLFLLVIPSDSTYTPAARPQFLMCDIIGSLDAMPQEWLDNGIPGNWLAVGEEGEDLIPDGTVKNLQTQPEVLGVLSDVVFF